MPKFGITAYDLLISCPGDVSDEIVIIKEVVDSFNRTFGNVNNIEVMTKHWYTDSFPQAGDKPQELLNKQFIRECDAAVAVFWTRFGTPTDKYQSGTEEEIAELISAGKQVFLYFLDKPISLSDVDLDQYEKVQHFKEKYKDMGIYSVIKDEEEFRKQFLNHLSLYFLKLFVGTGSVSLDKPMPILQLRNLKDMSNKTLNIIYCNLMETKFVKKKEERISEIFESIKEINLPMRSPKDEVEIEKKQFQLIALAGLQSQFGQSSEADINEKTVEEIQNYFEKRHVLIPEGYWNVGNLKKRINIVASSFSNNGPTLEGEDKEKEKYSLLNKLYWKIVQFNEYNNFFSDLQSKGIASCVISNIGKTYDEDIDIKIIIKKGHICKINDIPVPSINIIEEVNNFVDALFKKSDSESVDTYTDYPLYTQHYIDPILTKLQQRSVQEEFEDNLKIYKRKINNIFCYKYYETDDNDVLISNIKYLKQNTNMHLPSPLFFNQIPEFIKYEIRSRHSPDVVTGELTIIK